MNRTDTSPFPRSNQRLQARGITLHRKEEKNQQQRHCQGLARVNDKVTQTPLRAVRLDRTPDLLRILLRQFLAGFTLGLRIRLGHGQQHQILHDDIAGDLIIGNGDHLGREQRVTDQPGQSHGNRPGPLRRRKGKNAGANCQYRFFIQQHRCRRCLWCQRRNRSGNRWRGGRETDTQDP